MYLSIHFLSSFFDFNQKSEETKVLSILEVAMVLFPRPFFSCFCTELYSIPVIGVCKIFILDSFGS